MCDGVGCGFVRFGFAGEYRLGVAWKCAVRLDLVWQEWIGVAW